jgi:hypothetical protein
MGGGIAILHLVWSENHFLFPEELIHGGVTINTGVMEVSFPTSRRSLMTI